MEQLGQEDPQSSQRMMWAMLAMAVVFVLWAVFMGPGKKAFVPGESANQPQAQAQPERKVPPPVEKPEALKAPEKKVTAQEAIRGQTQEEIVLENDDLKLVLSNRGGVVMSAVVKRYTNPEGKVDDLVSPLSKATNLYPLALETGDEAFNERVNGALFHVEQSKTKNGRAVRMVWSDGEGSGVSKTFSLASSGYFLDFETSLTKNGEAQPAVPVLWGRGLSTLLKSEAKNRYFQKGYVGLETASGSFKKVKRSKVNQAKREIVDTYDNMGSFQWAALTNNFFAVVFLPKDPMPWAKVMTSTVEGDARKVHPADSTISLVVDYPGKGRLFLGPKEWRLLSHMAKHTSKLAGWGILTPLCAILLWGLKKLYLVCGNYGVAILLLTLIIKLAFYPLTQRSMVKMKEMGEGMKKLKPQIDRIKAKYKKAGKSMASRSKMNEEMMALYQREGINPLGSMGGCLPMVIQMPIFFAYFELLPRAIELRGAEFVGWIHDLSVPDPYYITPIIMGISMVLSTKMTATQSMEGGAQKMMIWFMPVFFTWICLWAPAGLNVYWLTNNVLTIGQQALINKKTAARKLALQKSKKSTPKKQSRPSHG